MIPKSALICSVAVFAGPSLIGCGPAEAAEVRCSKTPNGWELIAKSFTCSQGVKLESDINKAGVSPKIALFGGKFRVKSQVANFTCTWTKGNVDRVSCLNAKGRFTYRKSFQ